MDQESSSVKGLNLIVTHRDERTGLVIRRDPYTLRVVQSDSGGKTRLWERPANSGNLWDKKGNAIGRWEKDEKGRGRFLAGAAHKAFTAPMTEDQKLAQSVIAKDEKIATLEREIAQVKAEAAKKVAPAPVQSVKTKES